MGRTLGFFNGRIKNQAVFSQVVQFSSSGDGRLLIEHKTAKNSDSRVGAVQFLTIIHYDALFFEFLFGCSFTGQKKLQIDC